MAAADALQRLAQAGLRLAACEQQWRHCADRVEELARSDLELVDAERRLVDEMARRLADARSGLHALAAISPPGGFDADVALLAIEATLDDIVWGAAAEVQGDVDRRLQALHEAVHDAETELQGWSVQLSALERVINGARRDGAQFAPLDAALLAADSRVSHLRTTLQTRLYADLPQARTQAKATVEALERSVSEAGGRVERMRKLVRQADLLIMRSGRLDGDHDYRVLLRCADQGERRGIQIIQDVRKLSRVDRDWITTEIIRITQGIANRARRIGTPAVANADAPVTGPREAMVAVGQFMRRMVIPKQMQTMLSTQDWSFSITTNDLELPWELICFEDEESATDQFFCLTKAVSRMPLGDEFPPVMRVKRPDPTRKRRMLLIHSDPDGNLPAAAAEVQDIAAALAPHLEITKLEPDQATNARLNQVLSGPPFDFVHYAGHAVFDTTNPSLSGLQLKDVLLTAEKIQRLNRGGALVFLNACESGTAGLTAPGPDLFSRPEPVLGLASAFIYSGALGCVGSLWPVLDRTAAKLAVRFYQLVLEGEPTGEALRQARADARHDDPTGVTWAGYVLYGSPTFRLTEV
ncbi:CHAT domain-containing protein [Sphaerotilus montanus]|uniref:CHAT domain-containing protein n=1 Tax=Sphaerotilus montanus TaxID=522889 RepID=UPI003FA27035